MAGEPMAPSGMTATAVSSSRINTAWVDNAVDVAGANEVQTVTFGTTPSSGVYTLTFDGETTANIDHDANAAAIIAALEATAAFEVGDVAVDKTGNVITITYQGGLAAMALPEITANGEVVALNYLVSTADTIAINVTQSGIADVASTPSINTTTSAVAEAASTPSINTTQSSNSTDTPQIDTITFDATPVAGSMTLDGNSLAWNADASTLSISGATASGTPSSGTITITWSDFEAHSPVSVAAGSLLSVVGVHQVDTITFDATPAGGSFQIALSPLDWDDDASTLTGLGATLSGTPASGTITITWDDFDSHTPFELTSNTLLSVVGRVHIFTITLSDAPTEGSLKITKSGNDSEPWPYNAAAGTVETAIETISGGYACSVTGSAGGPWTVTSDDKIAAPTWTASEVDSLLKSVSITVGTTTQGSPQSWDDLGTEVHRSTDGSSYSLLVDLGANMESWPDETCDPSTQYWYKSRSYNAGGFSAFSNVDDATTDAAAATGDQSAAIYAILPAARAAMASPFNWGI